MCSSLLVFKTESYKTFSFLEVPQYRVTNPTDPPCRWGQTCLELRARGPSAQPMLPRCFDIWCQGQQKEVKKTRPICLLCPAGSRLLSLPLSPTYWAFPGSWRLPAVLYHPPLVKHFRGLSLYSLTPVSIRSLLAGTCCPWLLFVKTCSEFTEIITD